MAETDKYISKVKDELENLSSKINRTYDLESVLEIDNNSNHGVCQSTITMSSVFCSIRAAKKVRKTNTLS